MPLNNSNEIPIDSLESVRIIASNFCKERDWSQFHSPPNLLLALAGEVGEVCECFQWKGDLQGYTQNNYLNPIPLKFNKKEIIHIGEEISDVMIYCIRLSDIMGIDLSSTLISMINNEVLNEKSIRAEMKPWNKITFSEIETKLKLKLNNLSSSSPSSSPLPLPLPYKSPRHCAMNLFIIVSKLIKLFSIRNENENINPWNSWPSSDVLLAAECLGEIIINMVHLSFFFQQVQGSIINNEVIALDYYCDLHVENAIHDKFRKNNEKYPANLVKGSSEKYTAYREAARAKAAETKEKENKSKSNYFSYNTLGTVTIALGLIAAGAAAASVITRRNHSPK
jgi:dCTP diphosphatase